MSMAGLRLALVLCLGLVLAGCTAEEVPVFIWGNLKQASPRSNPLEVTSASQFERIVRDELQDAPLVIVFAEPTLSVEDLSRRDEGGPTFPYLRSKIGDSLYLPAVESPLKTLNTVAEPEHIQHVRVTDAERALPALEAAAARGGLVLAALEDARDEEPRAALLRRHDALMRAACGRLDALCVYTAHYPSWSVAEQPHERSRRQLLQATVPVANGSEHRYFNVTGQLLLVLKTISLSTGTGAARELEFTEESLDSRVNETELTVTVAATNYTLTLYVRRDAGYWFLEEADVTSTETRETERIRSGVVFALDDFSYHCSGSVQLTGPNSTYALTLTDFQIQPFFAGGGQKFGDFFDCHGFTTVPIWSGLFVVFIMLAIFFYGVTMMMDIRTMDRFDDPKGKTITISATE